MKRGLQVIDNRHNRQFMRLIPKPRIHTLLAASLGAAVFLVLGLPLPLLLGPMLGCLCAALIGATLQDMGTLGTVMRTFLGVAIGSSITPALIADLPRMGPTLALVPIFVISIGALGYPFFRRVIGYDHATAFYSAMPGGLQDMLIFGEEAGGNLRAMSLIHATRVLVIVSAAPVLMTLIYDVDLASAPGRPALDVPFSQIALMIAAGLIGWRVAARIGLFGASILGPLILTACLSLAGLIEGRPPAEMIWAAQFFIGISVGAKYTGITAQELRRDVTAGLSYALLLALISLGFVELALQISDHAMIEILLSFLPGGQAEMAVIAIVAGADVAFVVAHHMARIFIVILMAPLVARWLNR